MSVREYIKQNNKVRDNGEKDQFLYPHKEFSFFSRSLIVFAKAVLRLFNSVFLGLKVTGSQHLENIEGGAVTICNHVNKLDCAMVACQIKKHNLAFPTLRSNLEIPFIGHLVKYLGGFSVPESVTEHFIFSNRVENLLERGIFVHFYPERELIPYCTDIRDFRRGAFWYAYNCNVPIIPMVITYRDRDGIRCLFRQKPSINLTIFPPVYPDPNKPKKEEISRLMACCKKLMEDTQT